MRFPNDQGAASDLVQMAVGHGMDWFHASPEYDAWGATSAALAAASKHDDLTVALKVAEPSFSSSILDVGRLRDRVLALAAELGHARLEIQWMVRTPDAGSEDSLTVLRHGFEAASQTLDELVASGTIEKWGFFPYTVEEAAFVLTRRPTLRVYSYLHPGDLTWLGSMGDDFVAFRSLGAQSWLESSSLGGDLSPEMSSLRFVVTSPKVARAVGSFSTEAHLLEAIEVERSTSASAVTFDNAVAALVEANP